MPLCHIDCVSDEIVFCRNCIIVMIILFPKSLCFEEHVMNICLYDIFKLQCYNITLKYLLFKMFYVYILGFC